MSVDINTKIDDLNELLSTIDTVTNTDIEYGIDNTKFDKDKFMSIYNAAKLKYPTESHYILYMATLSCLMEQNESE